ncbi:MAG: hypothetical protein V8R25_05915 [Alphaproteobacteria bacterium]
MKFALGGLSPSRADILSSYPYTYILFFFLPVCPLRASVLTLSRGDTMKKSVLMFSLLSGTALMFPKLTIASGLPAHTLTYTPEPKPAFQFEQPDKAYKTAGVCFLGVGDCGGAAGYDSSSSGAGSSNDDFYIDTSNQCLNEGFVRQNCNSVQTIDGVCPYNSAYGLGCKCRPDLISCPAGQVGVGESCDDMYASCECDPALVSCSAKENGTGASCGDRYESCVCKPEYQYTSSNCSYPRSVSGDSCGGQYTDCVCPAGVDEGPYGCAEYYPSPCSSVCKVAYSDNCHIRNDDPNTALGYGCMKEWDDCSTKCERAYTDMCRERTAVISSCPDNATCSSFSDCSSKIQSWSCKSGYKQEGSSCVADVCKIGYIYYTDGKCLPSTNHDGSKTVLGIVVYVTYDGQHGQIMAPWSIDENGNKTNSNRVRMVWSDSASDMSSVPNRPTTSSASTDYDSCGNTDAIVAYSPGVISAAKATRKYAPTSGTNGKWCLPAAGIMTKIYNNQSTIQDAIKKVGGIEFPSICTWSSSESSKEYAWYSSLSASYGLVSHRKKTTCYIRPVLEF